MLGILVPVVLSIGAIYALIPLMVIVALIAAAAGLSRGASIFQFFGFDALVGLAGGVGAGAAGKGISKAVRYQSDKAEQLTEVMKIAHKKRTGMARGTKEAREVKLALWNIREPGKDGKEGKIIVKRGITRMATSTERGVAITGLKSLYKNAGDLDLPSNLAGKITDQEAKKLTMGDLRQIKKATMGTRSVFGTAAGAVTTVAMVVPVVGGIPRAIENTLVHRSSTARKLMYTGPAKGDDTDNPNAKALRDAWNKSDSLSSQIKESKKKRDSEERQQAVEARNEIIARHGENSYAGRMAAASGPLKELTEESNLRNKGPLSELNEHSNLRDKMRRSLYEDWGIGGIAASAVAMSQVYKILTSSGSVQERHVKEIFDSYKTSEKAVSAPPLTTDINGSSKPINDYTGWNGYFKAVSGAYKAALVDATVAGIYKPWYDNYTKSGKDEKQKAEEKKKAEEEAKKEAEAEKKQKEAAANAAEGTSE
ncbi:MAG TPA: hypothetical protein VND15_04040 [Candidatus Acidoferrales bacterium]|nr:hypothetical protein [Candidatus Acidoferrales bacterium]